MTRSNNKHTRSYLVDGELYYIFLDEYWIYFNVTYLIDFIAMQDRNKINIKLIQEYVDRIFPNSEKLRIVTISTYKSNYTRTESLHQLFNQCWFVCDIINFYPKPYPIRYIAAIFSLLRKIRKNNVVLIHFRAYELFIPVLIICKIFRKKLIVDHFVSIRDTLCCDRRVFKPHWVLWKFLLWFDRFILNSSDFILVDTIEHKNFFINTLEWLENKIWHLYVWCNTKIFFPLKDIERNHDEFEVFWYGNVLPLQWVDIILKAAKICENNSKIHFTIVWPVYNKHKNLIDSLQLTNVDFIDRLDYELLPNKICWSDLCLWGHFSWDIEKAKRVIWWKSYQFISCGVPTILGECDANRELYSENESIYFVEMWNPKTLANLIMGISWKKT